MYVLKNIMYNFATLNMCFLFNHPTIQFSDITKICKSVIIFKYVAATFHELMLQTKKIKNIILFFSKLTVYK
jgi:hypothetical protein